MHARILLSEGSSLSARQAITALGLAGHDIEICDPDPFCIGRFSRFVRRFHRCPGLGSEPAGYLAFLLNLLTRERFDVLLPTHEQGYLLAKVLGRIAPLTGIALPAFGDYVAAYGKADFSRLLTELPCRNRARRSSFRFRVAAMETFPSRSQNRYRHG